MNLFYVLEKKIHWPDLIIFIHKIREWYTRHTRAAHTSGIE
jgi:hypothetical protein